MKEEIEIKIIMNHKGSASEIGKVFINNRKKSASKKLSHRRSVSEKQTQNSADLL